MSLVAWSCTSCSKTFRRKGDLTRHELLHTGIKPHVCETCGKSFAQYSGLRHIGTFTPGSSLIVVALAPAPRLSEILKETHRREGVYKCIVADCGIRIKRRSTLVAHLRKHGFDTDSLDLNAIVLQTGGGEIPAPTHLASPDLATLSRHDVQSRSVSSSFLSDSERRRYAPGPPSNHLKDCGSYTLADSSEGGSSYR